MTMAAFRAVARGGAFRSSLGRSATVLSRGSSVRLLCQGSGVAPDVTNFLRKEENKRDRRLLCASVLAQSISLKDGDFGLPEEAYRKYAKGAELSEGTTVVQGGLANIDACLVGTNPDGVVVAFRGTTTPKIGEVQLNPCAVQAIQKIPWLRGLLETLPDWLQDLLPVLIQKVGVEVKDLPGRVHGGFYAAVAGIWSKNKLAETSAYLSWERQLASCFYTAHEPKVWLVDAIGNHLAASKVKKIYVTGHSKGAAMAPLAAYLMSLEGYESIEVVAFASPNPGDEEFAKAYNCRFDQVSYENYFDLVTLVPGPLLKLLPECMASLFRKKQSGDLSPAGTTFLEGVTLSGVCATLHGEDEQLQVLYPEGPSQLKAALDSALENPDTPGAMIAAITKFLEIPEDSDLHKTLKSHAESLKAGGPAPDMAAFNAFSVTHFAPVGKRVIIGKNGKHIISAPDKERLHAILFYLITQLITQGSDAPLKYLLFAHCKQCKDGDTCMGRYMQGVRAFSVCGTAC